MFEAWFVGDNFFADAYGVFAEMQEQAIKPNTAMSKTYLQEYYNMKGCFELGKIGVTHMAPQIINSLIEAFNQTHKLPRFLIIMPKMF